MATVTPHPYRTALESRDAEALAAALHPDVTFDSPAFDAPLRGRDTIVGLFAVLAGVFEDPEITDELVGDGTRAITFRLSVDGRPIEGVDYLRLDEEGLVRSITVSLRPLSSVLVLAARMAEPYTRLLASQPSEDVEATGEGTRD
jgi:hypothetical protein